jgi:hypothetical protein
VDTLDNVVIIWVDQHPYFDGYSDTDIYLRQKFKSTNSWSGIELISIDGTYGGNVRSFSQYPSIAIDTASIIHVVWFDGTFYSGYPGTDLDIVYRRSSDPSYITVTETEYLTDTQTSTSVEVITSIQTLTTIISSFSTNSPINSSILLLTFCILPIIRWRKKSKESRM